jgi:small subunit ribosomal protein S1
VSYPGFVLSNPKIKTEKIPDGGSIMHVETSLEPITDEMDFAALLEESLAKSQPERGDIVTGTVLSVDSYGLIVDVSWKRDGIVQRRDLDRLGIAPDHFSIGQEVEVTIVRMEDDEGNLILSVAQALQNVDWKNAEALMENDEVWHGEVIEANRGGLIVPFGNLRGFIPASHVGDLPRGLNEDERQDSLNRLVGASVEVKVIEVNRKRRRLVFSQREAQREAREERKELLLAELKEGEVRKGVVSGLRDFGAFVDLGGADGLIHISELAWHRVKHPREILKVGDEVDVYILRLDAEGRRIGLSLKRLQKNPWELVEEMYYVGQLVEGTVSRVADFGAFISMEPGIEALLHVSQISQATVQDATTVLRDGQFMLMRVISIEAEQQRLGLSLKEVTKEERNRWVEQKEAEGQLVEIVDVDADLALDAESELDLAPEAVENAEADASQAEDDTVQSEEQVGEVEVNTAS